jgi:hypothetical protein
MEPFLSGRRVLRPRVTILVAVAEFERLIEESVGEQDRSIGYLVTISERPSVS